MKIKSLALTYEFHIENNGHSYIFVRLSFIFVLSTLTLELTECMECPRYGLSFLFFFF